MYIIRPFCEGPVKTSLFPATKSIPRRKDQSLTQGIHWCCEPVVPLKQHVVGYKSNIVHTYIDIYAYHNMVYNVIHSLIIYIYLCCTTSVGVKQAFEPPLRGHQGEQFEAQQIQQTNQVPKPGYLKWLKCWQEHDLSLAAGWCCCYMILRVLR